MFLSKLRKRPAFLAVAMTLGLAACGGASSDESATSNTGGAPVENAGVGALAEMVLGDKDASVTVIEYASLTCPHCATFHETIFPAIKENYVDTGKVRFIYRDFPTAVGVPVSPESPEGHDYGRLATAVAMIARCVADVGGQDGYFLLLDNLFKTQGDPRERTGWIYGDNRRAELISITAQAGLDEAELDACATRQDTLDLINKNVKEGSERYKVNSTPSFIINGKLRHFSNVEDFSAALDTALEKAAQ